MDTSETTGTSVSKIIFRILISFFAILIIITIFTIATQYQKVSKKKKEINANWPKYRCQPHVAPFAGWLVGPPGTSGVTNFLECGLLVFQNSFSRFMAPVFEFLDNLLNVVLDLVRSVENIRKMTNYLRDSMRNYLTDIGNMFYGYGKKISYLFNRLMQTFKLMFQTFYYLFFTVAFSIYTVASVWNSSIGGVGRYFCFSENTPIQMKNGLNRAIKDLEIGDELLFGGRIIATMKFPGVNLYVYPNKYNGYIFVSGDHLVLENNKWIRVKDSAKALVSNNKDDIIYCLVTERGKIYSQGVMFSDYQEAETDSQFYLIRKLMLESLNEEKHSILKNIGEEMIIDRADRVWGIDGNIKVKLKDGNMKKIKQLEIGDDLEVGGKVEGFIVIDGGSVEQYYYKNSLLSGDIIVKEDGKWIPVKRSMEALKVSCLKERMYNVLTEENKINVNNILMVDFDQTLDKDINDTIDDYIEKFLNKN